jgi:hypothetical protein
MLLQISLGVICAGFGGNAVAVGGIAVLVLVGVMVGASVSWGAGVEVGLGVLVSTAV